jgi:hypothetical protein
MTYMTVEFEVTVPNPGVVRVLSDLMSAERSYCSYFTVTIIEVYFHD